MPQVTCELPECERTIELDGTGHPYRAKKIEDSDATAFFCSQEHFDFYEKLRKAGEDVGHAQMVQG